MHAAKKPAIAPATEPQGLLKTLFTPVPDPKADTDTSTPKKPLIPPLPWASIRHRLRHAARPWYVMAAVTATGYAADTTNIPTWGMLAAVPLSAAVAWKLSPRWLKNTPDADDAGRKAARAERRRRYTTTVTTATATWIAAANQFGADPHTTAGKILLTTMGVLGPLLAAPYWAYHRANPTTPATTDNLDAELAKLGEYEQLVLQRWDASLSGKTETEAYDLAVSRAVAAGEKPPAPPKRKVYKLPGTWLESWKRVEGGWSAIACCTPGTVEPDKWESAKAAIAGAYHASTGMVTVVVDPTNNNKAMVMVQRHNPLAKGRKWDGQGIDPTTGRAPTLTAADGRRLEHQFWRDGWGAVMELIAGATGGGKSEYLNLLLALERGSDRIVSWVCDPQLGQSLGDIRDGIDWFAPTAEELVIMLRCAKRVMLARSVLLTRMRVLDDKGRERRVKYLPPTPDRPLISISIDEAHLPINDPEYGAEILSLLALLAKSGRKANIKLRILLQSPLLSELKSSVLRGQLRSGLVTIFRIADRLDSATAWPGKMPLSPVDLPAEWPNGTTAAGVCIQTGQPPMMLRSDYADDIYDLMHDGDPLSLETPVLDVAGPDYAERHARLEAFDNADPAVLMGLQEALHDAEADALAVRQGGKDGRTKVLLYLYAANEPKMFGVIAKGVELSTRQATTVCKKLLKDGLVKQGKEKEPYELTPAGRVAAAALAEEHGATEDDELAEVA